MKRIQFLQNVSKATIIMAARPAVKHLNFLSQAQLLPKFVVNGDLPNGFRFFPPDNPWNTPIDHLPLDPLSDQIIANHIGHGNSPGMLYVELGTPYNVVNNLTPQILLVCPCDYVDPENPSKFPIVSGMAIEASDPHLLIVDVGTNKLYELYYPAPVPDGTWFHEGAAMFDLTSNNLRTLGMTSADAAGLPILPGLIRYQELLSGSINHALRMTLSVTLQKYISPARHYTTTGPVPSDGAYAPMGARFRLKSSFDDSQFPPMQKIITTCLKKYGAFVADNGTNFAFQGTTDSRFHTLPFSNDCCLNLIRGDDGQAMMNDLELVQMGK